MKFSSLPGITMTMMVFSLSTTNHVEATPPQSTAAQASRFESWATTFFSDPDADVVIPNAAEWFADNFDTATAQKLTPEYEAQSQAITGLKYFIKQVKQEGKTELKFRHTEKAIDLKANGLQNALMQRMKTPIPLHTLVMVKPGEANGTTLWSFVEVEGEFRFLGKMESLNPTEGDLITDVLCQLPLADAEELLRGKGLDTSAVEYLRQKGILK